MEALSSMTPITARKARLAFAIAALTVVTTMVHNPTVVDADSSQASSSSWIPSSSYDTATITEQQQSGNNNEEQVELMLRPDYYDTIRALSNPNTNNRTNHVVIATIATPAMVINGNIRSSSATQQQPQQQHHPVDTPLPSITTSSSTTALTNGANNIATSRADSEVDNTSNMIQFQFSKKCNPYTLEGECNVPTSNTSISGIFNTSSSSSSGNSSSNNTDTGSNNNMTTTIDNANMESFLLCELTTLLPYTYSQVASTTTTAPGSEGTPSNGGNNNGSNEGQPTGTVEGTSTTASTLTPRARVHEDSAAVLLAIYLFNNAASNDQLGQALDSIINIIPTTYAASKQPAPGTGEDNNGKDGIVGTVLSQCNIKFTTTLINTFLSPIKSTSKLTQIFQSPQTSYNARPCAVIGPYSSMVTSPTAILSSVKNTPQVSYAASSTDFDDKEQYPKFARTSTNTVADANAILSYLQSIGVTHVGMIFVESSYGSSMAKSMQDAASTTSNNGANNNINSDDDNDGAYYDITVDPVSISFDSYAPDGKSEIASALRYLKNTEYRYFLGVLMDVHYEAVMLEAYAQGLIGNGGGHRRHHHRDSNLSGDITSSSSGGNGNSSTANRNGTTEDEQESSGAGNPRDDDDFYDNDGGGYVWLVAGADMEVMKEKVQDYEFGTPLADATAGVGVLRVSGPRLKTTATTGADTNNAVIPSSSTTPVTNNGLTNYDNFKTNYGKAISDPHFQSYVRSKQPTSINNETLVFQDTPTEWGHFLFDTVLGLGIAACNATLNKFASGNGTFVTGDELYNTFMNVHYDGASGEVKLNPYTGTRMGNTVTYEMLNVVPSKVLNAEQHHVDETAKEQPNFVLVSSAIYGSTAVASPGGNSLAQWVSVNPFVYNDGSTVAPISLPPALTNENYIGSPSRIAGFVLASMVISLAILFAGWATVKRSQHIVKAAHATFLIMLCIGSIVMASAIIPLSLEETVASAQGLHTACMIYPWLFVVGFSTMFSALFAKTWTLYKVYRDPDLDNIAMTLCHLLSSFAFFFTVNVALLLSWTLTSPLQWRRIFSPSKDEFDRYLESYGTCTAIQGRENSVLAFVGLILVFNLSALLFANILAYQSRSVKTEFRESHYIGITVASILQTWCLGIPIMIVVFQTPRAKFWVEAGIIFVISAATLILLFSPKVIAHRNELIREEQERRRECQRNRERSRQPSFDTDMDTRVRNVLKMSFYTRTSSTLTDVETPGLPDSGSLGASGFDDKTTEANITSSPSSESEVSEVLGVKLAVEEANNCQLRGDKARVEN